MRDLINIFNFGFLSIFNSDINLNKNDESNESFKDFKKMKDIYKKTKEIFGNEIIKKLNYFHFEISYVGPPCNFGGKFIYKYGFLNQLVINIFLKLLFIIKHIPLI